MEYIEKTKWEMHIVGPGIWQGKWKTWKIRNTHGRIWNMTRNTGKCGKSKMYTEGPGIWGKNRKTWKMRHTHCRTWNMAKNTEKHAKWDTHTVGPEIWKKKNHWKTWKIRSAHCRNWNMPRILKNVENETQTLYDLEYGKKTDKRGKWETHMVGPGLWWENWKTCKMRNAHCRN